MKTQGAAKETEPRTYANYREENGVGFYSRNGVKLPIYHSVVRVKDADYHQHTLCWYDGKVRKRRRFSELPEAIKEADIVVTKLLGREKEVLDLKPSDRNAYVHAVKLLRSFDPNRDLNTFVAECVDAVKLLPEGTTLKECVEAAKLVPDGSTIKEAVTDFARRRTSKSKSVSDLVEEFIAGKEKAARSHRHIRDLRSRLGRFAENYQMPVSFLTPDMLQEYLNGRDVSARSKRNEWGIITSLLNYAVRKKFAPRDLLDELKSIELAEVKAGPTLIFTPEELEEMLIATRADVRPWLVLAAFCGVRSAELQRLDWKDVNFKRRFVEIRADKAKTSSRRLIPLCDAALEWLAPHVGSEGRLTLYQEESKVIAKIISDTNAARLAAEAEAAKAEGREPREVKPFKWKRNALRHSFCSYRLVVLNDAAKVALEAGNSPKMLFAHYRELAEEDEGKRWFNVRPVNEANLLPMVAES